MPTVTIERDLLFERLGRTYTDEAFDELCFEYGIELDEITSERAEIEKSIGATGTNRSKELEAYSDTVVYKIDVPANRYDLLCIEGIARALRIFLGDMDAPVYRRLSADDKATATTTMTVRSQNTATIRPFVVCAVLRDISFDEHRYKSFMDLQDQLHRNLCRQRTLVAIGTHDMDSITPPFIYDARPPTEICFVPLTPDDRGTFTAASLMEHYETDPSCKHLKPYVPIIKDSALYPVVLDSNDVVLSLPPIINGSQSKITLQTKNVFIECTATDLTKANVVLDTMVTMFCEYCSAPFTVESVVVNYVDIDDPTIVVNSYTTPLLSSRREQASVEFCNSMIGINITADAMKTLCNKVQLGPAILLENDTLLEVTVPPTRSDILHAVDIAEDIGIAYGYNNIVKRIPATSTVGGEFPLNHVTDLLRDEIGRAGYTEVLTHGLCSIHDNYTALKRPIPDAASLSTTAAKAVSLSNPANIEYQVIRTTLLPGLLKTLQHNKSASFTNGFKLFEISDVVVSDDTHVVTDTIVGAKNIRKICAVYAGPTSGFEVIHGLVDRIMTLLEIAPEPAYIANSSRPEEEKFRIAREGWNYAIQPIVAVVEGECNTNNTDGNTYFPGRAASVVITKPAADTITDQTQQTATMTVTTIGTFGILHPDVLASFDIQYPASAVELELETLM